MKEDHFKIEKKIVQKVKEMMILVFYQERQQDINKKYVCLSDLNRKRFQQNKGGFVYSFTLIYSDIILIAKQFIQLRIMESQLIKFLLRIIYKIQLKPQLNIRYYIVKFCKYNVMYRLSS
ncbi:unnamed protein product [Paramecium primaurelia]|uniref:Transmembrane protein n=1 Tax=Paramecium primaurelia TaxID=5886 RepID=A0A8S1M3L3_PARPR|nr:unnamed protein product [Paramecium primaurelia]